MVILWRCVRGEEIKIEVVVGLIIYEVRVEDFIREGFLVKLKFEIIIYELKMFFFSECYKEFYEDMIMNNDERNRVIVKKVIEFVRKGYRVFIDVRRIEYGKILKEMLEKEGIKVEFFSL